MNLKPIVTGVLMAQLLIVPVFASGASEDKSSSTQPMTTQSTDTSSQSATTGTAGSSSTMGTTESAPAASATSTPPASTDMTAAPATGTQPTLAEALMGEDNLSEAAKMLADLPLTDTQKVAILAPTDDAINASKDTAASQKSSHYVVYGSVANGKIQDYTTFTTADGTKVTVSKSGDKVMLNDKVPVLKMINFKNGVIYEIGALL